MRHLKLQGTSLLTSSASSQTGCREGIVKATFRPGRQGVQRWDSGAVNLCRLGIEERWRPGFRWVESWSSSKNGTLVLSGKPEWWWLTQHEAERG